MQIEIIRYFNLNHFIEVTTHRLIVLKNIFTPFHRFINLNGTYNHDFHCLQMYGERHARLLYDIAADSPSTLH